MTGRSRFVGASLIAVVLAAAFLPGSGRGSAAAVMRGAPGIPSGLAAAIHARFGPGTIRSSSAVPKQPPAFGYSVSLSAEGTTALVGAPGANGWGGWDSKGGAYVFHVSGAGSWSSTKTPVASLRSSPTPPKEVSYGDSVALSPDGTTAFVSQVFDASVYVFHVSSEDAWASSSTPTATLTLDTSPTSLAPSLDGTTLLVGAPFSGDHLAGGAYVFHVSSEDAWASTSAPTATLRNAGQSSEDGNAGWSVALSGDGTTALLGDQSNPDGGGAYVYHVSAEDGWTDSSSPTAILTDTTGGGLGNGVALSGDGTVAVLAAPGVMRPGTGEYTGAIDVFHASGEAAWATTSTPTAILTDAGDSEDDMFGGTVAVSADGMTVLVTAPGHAYPHGGAYVFHASSEASWATTSAATAILVNHARRTGNIVTPVYTPPALSADGTTAFDGAQDAEFSTGEADVFHVSDASSWASTSAPTAVLTNAALAACLVPRVLGLKLPVARSLLKLRHCRLGKVIRVMRPRKWKGRVLSQSRKQWLRLPAGARIAVKVGK